MLNYFKSGWSDYGILDLDIKEMKQEFLMEEFEKEDWTKGYIKPFWKLADS